MWFVVEQLINTRNKFNKNDLIILIGGTNENNPQYFKLALTQLGTFIKTCVTEPITN